MTIFPEDTEEQIVEAASVLAPDSELAAEPGAETLGPEKVAVEPVEKEEVVLLKMIPTIQFYQRTYANSCGNNDVKAVKLFKEFENRDKVARLRTELHAISQGRASDELCAKILGLTRKAKHNGFNKWALMVLNALNSRA